MRKKLNVTDGIFPMPVLMIATYNGDGSVNVMNAAWGTMIDRDKVALNLSETHKTVKNIKERKGFTVSIADAAHVTEADYFGVVSGNNDTKNLKRAVLPQPVRNLWTRPSSTNSRFVSNANSSNIRVTKTESA